MSNLAERGAPPLTPHLDRAAYSLVLSLALGSLALRVSVARARRRGRCTPAVFWRPSELGRRHDCGTPAFLHRHVVVQEALRFRADVQQQLAARKRRLPQHAQRTQHAVRVRKRRQPEALRRARFRVSRAFPAARSVRTALSGTSRFVRSERTRTLT